MLTINFNDTSISIKNEINDFKIYEFEKMSSILSSEYTLEEKYDTILNICGLENNITESIDIENKKNIIDNLNLIDFNFYIPKFIILNNIKYVCYDKKFDISLTDMRLINDIIAENYDHYMSEILAIIYKRPDYNFDENYNDDHIIYKRDLIEKNIEAKIGLSIIQYLGELLAKNTVLYETTS